MDEKNCKYVYLCDKKKTECGDWKKKGLLECNSEFCKRTTDPEHAKNKAFRKFVLVDEKDPTFIEYETEIERIELEGMKEEILEAQKWRKENG